MGDRSTADPLPDGQPPDRIYPGGVVRAMASGGLATAFAVDDGRFVAVGSDAVIGSLAGRPVVVRPLSGHGVYAKSIVMHSKGIDRNTMDPEGGVIVRDAAGDPTGEFRAIPAMRLVVDPSETMPAAGELDDSLRRALARMASVGVTSFLGVDPVTCDPPAIKDIEVLATVVGGRVVYAADRAPGSALDGSHEGRCA